MCHSGSKLTFMGTEIAPFIEWRYYEELEWFLLDYPSHAAHKNYVKALNHMYLDQPSLWQESYSQEGVPFVGTVGVTFRAELLLLPVVLDV